MTAVGRRAQDALRRDYRLLRRVRASVTLAVIALGLGLALASALGAVIWAVSSALHHAATG